jgi:hypothetical protein
MFIPPFLYFVLLEQILTMKISRRKKKKMPQFRPYWWITLISWMFCIIAIVTRFHHSISFPSTIRTIIARMTVLFKK